MKKGFLLILGLLALFTISCGETQPKPALKPDPPKVEEKAPEPAPEAAPEAPAEPEEAQEPELPPEPLVKEAAPATLEEMLKRKILYRTDQGDYKESYLLGVIYKALRLEAMEPELVNEGSNWVLSFKAPEMKTQVLYRIELIEYRLKGKDYALISEGSRAEEPARITTLTEKFSEVLLYYCVNNQDPKVCK